MVGTSAYLLPFVARVDVMLTKFEFNIGKARLVRFHDTQPPNSNKAVVMKIKLLADVMVVTMELRDMEGRRKKFWKSRVILTAMTLAYVQSQGKFLIFFSLLSTYLMDNVLVNSWA